MTSVPICIPQLGEGLQEARLVRFLKQPGETVKRDEPLFEMETDKAVAEVESPHAGVIHSWLAEEDSVYEIGAEIGTMEIEGASDAGPTETEPGAAGQQEASPNATEPSVPDAPALWDTQQVAPASNIPPRTRRYLKEKNLESVASQIPASGSRLTEEDVDRYLLQVADSDAPAPAKTAQPTAKDPFEESTLSSTQQTLNFRMARGAQLVIPATLETDLPWNNVKQCRDKTRESGGPTGFAMTLWCIAQAMDRHPALRSTLGTDGKVVRTYSQVNLGIAVALPGDELKTAVVRHANTMTQQEFFQCLVERIAAARAGVDQIDATTTVSVSNIGAYDMRAGIPVVVAPAVATIAIGQVRPQLVAAEAGVETRLAASLTMSFDHRLINGVGAANFLCDIRKQVTDFALASPD